MQKKYGNDITKFLVTSKKRSLKQHIKKRPSQQVNKKVQRAKQRNEWQKRNLSQLSLRQFLRVSTNNIV